MSNQFYKGRTNNHLTFAMVDATDFATPESALSAAMKIKIWGKVRGATGVNFVSSGTGSLTNDIQHVGASVLGLYTIALAKADLSDASAAWYDQYIISLSATGAAYQALVVDGGIDLSALSKLQSTMSDMQSYLVVMSGVQSDLYSLLSDHHSDFQSRVPKAVATNSQLSDLASDLRSYLVVMSGVQSDLYSLLSDHHSDFQSRVPKLVATNSQLSDLASDVKSAVQAITVSLDASNISDIASAVVAALPITSMVSDIYSLLSDLQSDFQSRVPKRVATDSQLSDLASDIKSAVAGITATLSTSDISDIASAVRATLASDLSDILSAATQTNSRVLVVQSMASDIRSHVSDLQSDFQSRVPKAVATNSQLSDLQSDLRSYLVVMSGVQSDVYSLLSDLQSDFQSRVPKRVATDSQLSDLASDLRSVAIVGQSYLSDILSAVTVVDDFLDTEIAAIKAKTDNLPEGIQQNTALSNFEFFMVDSADHVTGKTGLTVTAERSIDGGAFAACANAVSEVANGVYKITLATTDTNGGFITLKFTAAGADATLISFKTEV